ncbi:SDR family NAD(P)-dependent oxidoreductase [Litoribrevibacter euphylliae]|uniref:SDR family NAD(P)-dependent oxidoreductase n=1 Tax=Litoribrevibacter euphylliae TaxID=1834034 RepID=A0ABV7HAR0_9GAMM
MQNFKNKVAAITGAASGIGAALAESLARKGCNLALADINEANLENIANKLAHTGVKITQHVLDVSNQKAVANFASDVMKQHKGINLVINNAGVALAENIDQMSYGNFEWLMNINFWGVVYGTKEFLPYLKQSTDAHIVNVSSVFGLYAVPTQSAYNASKFAVRGFTESLQEELRIEGSDIQCTCVFPSGIKTNIAQNGRMGNTADLYHAEELRDKFDDYAHTTPEEAAENILTAVLTNKERALIGIDAYAMDLLQRLLPSRYKSVFVQGTKLANWWRARKESKA